MKVFKYTLFIALAVIIISSCKKKEDFEYDNRPTTIHFANSSARVVNISDYSQVTVNGKKLTNFITPQVGVTLQPSGTSYFPATGTLAGNGNAWYLPQDIINADGTAQVTLTSLTARYSNGTSSGDSIQPTSFKAVDNLNNPVDYYAISWYSHYANFSGGDTVIAVPRSTAAPSNPTHFKIRVLNLMDKDDPSNLKGALTLTYGDGTPVSTTTTGVQEGGHSDYIELPYGSYQFRLETTNGSMLPGATGLGQESVAIQYLDPTTGIMVDGNNNFLNNVIAPLQSYEAGGVYTIVASVNGVFYPYYDQGSVFINSFRTIADISTPINISYGRLQAVNVIPGSTINIMIDGQSLANSLAYSNASDYQICVKGNHDIKAVDQNGNVLAEQTLAISENDVWTAWVYTNNGKAAIAFATDNLSGDYYNNALGGDHQSAGVADEYHYIFSSPIRFLNFCQGLPYATFTDQNGQPLQQNIALGQVVTTDAYTIRSPLNFPAEIRAYQSQVSPVIVPGNWLSAVTPLLPGNFIANPAMYSKGNFTGLPNTEFGAYTVALIGSMDSSAPADQKARLLIIKHNK